MKMDDAINTIEGLMKSIQTNGHGTPEESDIVRAYIVALAAIRAEKRREDIKPIPYSYIALYTNSGSFPCYLEHRTPDGNTTWIEATICGGITQDGKVSCYEGDSKGFRLTDAKYYDAAIRLWERLPTEAERKAVAWGQPSIV